jgi:hypothetical protein
MELQQTVDIREVKLNAVFVFIHRSGHVIEVDG